MARRNGTDSRARPSVDDYSDLRKPESWYPKARKMIRKIIYHVGPTNSGKTFEAIEKFIAADSGIYCCPLRLLASEIFDTVNKKGRPCDMVTGEEVIIVDETGIEAAHVACTVQKANFNKKYKIAVIDEIQMIANYENGWAWTRALLGLQAEEIHVCGEGSAISLVGRLLEPLKDVIHVCPHNRPTELKMLDYPLDTFANVEPGDCIVCFSRNDVRHIVRQLTQRGVDCAKIYGKMPPGAKKAQARKFNNDEDPCTVLVATDAIGMGLNLSIKRIIFYSLEKPTETEYGRRKERISASWAQHIAGRAGRQHSKYTEGEYTAFSQRDMAQLRRLMDANIPDLKQAGLRPPPQLLEKFINETLRSAHANPRHTSLHDLLELFCNQVRIDESKYFHCSLEDLRFASEILQRIDLTLEDMYMFCTAPIPSDSIFIHDKLLCMAKMFQKKEVVTGRWIKEKIQWEHFSRPPKSIKELERYEEASQVILIYYWLGNQFREYFPNFEEMDEMQAHLDEMICIAIDKMGDLEESPKRLSSPYHPQRGRGRGNCRPNFSGGPNSDVRDHRSNWRGPRSEGRPGAYQRGHGRPGRSSSHTNSNGGD